MPFSHRPTLKQVNKKFKSGHATKGERKRQQKGAGSTQGARLNRRNEARQAAKQKRFELVESMRIFGTGLRGEGARGGWRAGAPRIISVVALTPDVDSWQFVRTIEDDAETLGLSKVAGRSVEEAIASNAAFCELEATRFRQTLQFLPMPYGALLPTMDAVRCSDFVIILLSATDSVEPGSWGELCLRSLQAHGTPLVQAVVPSLRAADSAPWAKSGRTKSAARDAQGVRKSLGSFVQYFFPECKKVHVLDESADRGVLVRTLATSAPKRVAWRDFRSWLVAENAEYEPSDGAVGLLKVEGWIRGVPLSANRLVHIPDFGDYEVDRITYAPKTSRARGDAMDDGETRATAAGDVLDERTDEADELVSENEPDPLANEQTWPTEEEMADAPAAQGAVQEELPPAAPGTTPLSIRSRAEENARRKYEAAWIIEEDDEDEDEDEDDDDDDDDQDMSDGSDDADSLAAEAEGMEEEADDQEDADADAEYDEGEEQAAIAAFREQLQREREQRKDEEQDAQFPDEVDTPMDIPARQRFARYRAMESMHTTYWDPYEDLPEDYARIFQFDDFSKTRKRVESSALMEGVPAGVRACIWIRNVPVAAAERALAVSGAPRDKTKNAVPFVLFGLLRHEHKKSVINFTITRNTEYDAPVRSKDPLLVTLGFRRYVARPVYSQHGRSRRGNNVHKFERFLPHGAAAAVGSIYAPVTFGGATVPVVLMRLRSETQEHGYDEQGVSAEQTPHLVGSGSLLDVSPTRIIAKRIVLSGHPYKLHKKTATIRFMFFNSDDVRFYKPVTLRTKYGRTGHIRESLGTHGYFKAHFDGPLTQLDTVLMNLYKRVYPRWSTVFTQSREGLPLLE
ncbi:ribosome biogenesis protein tsr1 [Malassezia cuniculi]|uniref:Ribosome biogenesis protein tsr1 n=1 Tax=Malassezia cuniculi TaxID=948313 RepID=A0AAF0EVJ5_9BASI|nr:ribosome biogenesis protein tsr1 [Malassezia cuniculi]